MRIIFRHDAEPPRIIQRQRLPDVFRERAEPLLRADHLNLAGHAIAAFADVIFNKIFRRRVADPFDENPLFMRLRRDHRADFRERDNRAHLDIHVKIMRFAGFLLLVGKPFRLVHPAPHLAPEEFRNRRIFRQRVLRFARIRL